METLLVALVVAAAVLWAVRRVRRTVRAAARVPAAGAACSSCPVADRCDPGARDPAVACDAAAGPGTPRAGRTGPPR